MSQSSKVKEMVMQLHEKNLVLMNILRDIVENETSDQFSADTTPEEIARLLADKAVRQAEILGEIRCVLHQEDIVRRRMERAQKNVSARRHRSPQSKKDSECDGSNPRVSASGFHY